MRVWEKLAFLRQREFNKELDWDNAARVVIEDLIDLVPYLNPRFLIECAIALMREQPQNPLPLRVKAERIFCGPNKDGVQIALKIGWSPSTLPEGHSRTYSRKTLVEFSAIAVALMLVSRFGGCTDFEVTKTGDRADYYLNRRTLMLEVSGTDSGRQVHKRHREKTRQLLRNPYGNSGYVVVSCLSGRQACLSFHSNHGVGQ
jgi:hypothetical protein